MLIVFPLIVLTYTDMLRFSARSLIDHAFVEDLAILFSSKCEDVLLELVSNNFSLGLMSCQSLPLVFPFTAHSVAETVNN